MFSCFVYMFYIHFYLFLFLLLLLPTFVFQIANWVMIRYEWHQICLTSLYNFGSTLNFPSAKNKPRIILMKKIWNHCRLKFLHECVAEMNSVTNTILINSYKSFCWAVEILLRHVNGATLKSVFLYICFISYLGTVHHLELNLSTPRSLFLLYTFLLDIKCSFVLIVLVINTAV